MLGVILLLRDVTKFRELDRMKSEFVATASHELKTPLTSIGMSIELLQERAHEKLDERERELLDAASEDVERLRRLVLDLLDLSKIEAGKIELEFASVSVRALFDEALDAMAVQAEQDGVALTAEAADDLPDVRADASKTIWVLTNLIANALRHTDAGGRVELSADRAGSKVHVAVRDTGEGIPYEYQAKIFDKFVQVGGERSVGGSGLGLAIAKEIVRAHGGSIWVESVPGQGATFTFTLPVADGSHAA
jgi:NtrC-family two-component system sensor histidine kinase KinB